MEQKPNSDQYVTLSKIGSGFEVVGVLISVEGLETCILRAIQAEMNMWP